MANASLPQQIFDNVQGLGDDDQRKVLEFIQSLPQAAQPKTGAALAQLAGTISQEDLRTMERAIEEGCERIDSHEW